MLMGTLVDEMSIHISLTSNESVKLTDEFMDCIAFKVDFRC